MLGTEGRKFWVKGMSIFERTIKDIYRRFSAYVQGFKLVLFFFHVIEALKPMTELWQKSKIKWLF